MGRKIAVVGTAPSSVAEAPAFGADGWEVWLCSSFFHGRVEPGAYDRFFEIHPVSQMSRGERDEFLPWLDDGGKPIYVFHDLGLKNQVFYPRKEVEAALVATGFFTSTIAWMLALAIWEHRQGQTVDRIGLYGIDMATDAEYGKQKPGCLHFLSVARMIGIGVLIPEGSELHKVGLPYPDNADTPLALEIERKLVYAYDAIDKLKTAMKIAEAEFNHHLGQIEVLDALKRTLV